MMTEAEIRKCSALGLDRQNYWRFLRVVYGMDALSAWNYVKRVGPPPSVQEIRNAIAARKAGRDGITGEAT